MYILIYYRITVEEDEDTSMQICIQVWTGDGRSALLNVTEDIGQFSPFLPLYLRTIKQIDISSCRSFSAKDFLESIRACENLKELSLQGCKQFTQWHFTNYASEMKQLQYLDLENCCSFVYGSAFIMCSKLQDLRFFEFDPANIIVEIREWQYLFRTFFRIEFGYAFRHILPNQGFYPRAPPYAWLHDIEE